MFVYKTDNPMPVSLDLSDRLEFAIQCGDLDAVRTLRNIILVEGLQQGWYPRRGTRLELLLRAGWRATKNGLACPDCPEQRRAA